MEGKKDEKKKGIRFLGGGIPILRAILRGSVAEEQKGGINICKYIQILMIWRCEGGGGGGGLHRKTVS